MKIHDFIAYLETIASPALQESYDNIGLLTGNTKWECTGIIVSLDITEAVIYEAVEKKCNLVISHHPVIFTGLKKITGKNYVEKTIIAAIKNDVAIYAIHTNLDNILEGVNSKIADKLGLINRQILVPKNNALKKLFTFVPVEYAEKVRAAIFGAGGGNIGNYSECSFNIKGEGTFKANEGAKPYLGIIGKQHTENEIKIEIIFPSSLQKSIVSAMLAAHPYEEPAYDIIALDNLYSQTGSGLIAELPNAIKEIDFLKQIKNSFNISVIKHTSLTGKMVKKVALCGGSGSFLIGAAVAAEADFYITSDIKYHEFFDANNQMMIADIGHYESEQFTIDLIFEILTKKFPTFAVLKTEVKTNPVYYFL